ncbi:MAG: hypothetical protein HYY44_02440 [Deltaproteobacteria bacterium]|nr:hypothetical protein [Deltaproteobacteria bacterium]
MSQVEERKAVRVRCAQEVGQLAQVLAPLAEARVNIEAISAVTVNDEGYLQVVTDNNRKAIELWRKAGLVADEVDVIEVVIPNKAGELATVTAKLRSAKIDIRSCYASAPRGDNSVVWLSTSDNREALRKIRG